MHLRQILRSPARMSSSSENFIQPSSERLFIGRSKEAGNEEQRNWRSESRPVSIVVRRRVKPDCQAQFEAALQAFVRFAVSSPDHLDIHVLTQRHGGRVDCTVANRLLNASARCAFTSTREFRHWLQVLGLWTEEIPENHFPGNDNNPSAGCSAPGSAKDWLAHFLGPVVFFVLFGLTFSLPVLLYSLLSAWRPFSRNVTVAVSLLAVLVWIIFSCSDRLTSKSTAKHRTGEYLPFIPYL